MLKVTKEKARSIPNSMDRILNEILEIIEGVIEKNIQEKKRVEGLK